MLREVQSSDRWEVCGTLGERTSCSAAEMERDPLKRPDWREARADSHRCSLNRVVAEAAFFTDQAAISASAPVTHSTRLQRRRAASDRLFMSVRAGAMRTLAACLMVFSLASPAAAQDLADIDEAVVRAMARSHTPGVSAALVRACELADTRAWGLRDVLSRVPLRPDDAMQAASVGKPVAALGLVRLSRSGELGFALDAPLGEAASMLSLKPAEAAGKVTLGALLSHSAGLPPDSRTLASEPGATFRYSGAGFRTAQELADDRLDEPFVARMQDLVFAPARMANSTYAGTALAPPHMPVGAILMFLLPPWLGVAAVLLLVAFVARGSMRRGWRIGPRTIFACFVVAAGAACAILTVPLGVTAGATLVGLAVAFLMVGLVGAFVALLVRMGPWWLRVGVGALVGAASLGLAVQSYLLPLPTRLGGTTGNIAYSLVTTPADLARFAIVLMRPPPGLRDDVAAMLAPRVEAAPNIRWAAGIGVVRTPAGEEVLWQWGSNPGARALFLAVPQRCEAVTVLANGPQGDVVAREIARQLLSIDVSWDVN